MSLRLGAKFASRDRAGAIVPQGNPARSSLHSNLRRGEAIQRNPCKLGIHDSIVAGGARRRPRPLRRGGSQAGCPNIEWIGDLSEKNPFWPRTLSLTEITRQDEQDFYPKFFIALAVAWSPNPTRPPFYANLPFAVNDSGISPAEPAHSKWSANLIPPLAGKFRTELARLQAIRITYGTREQFPHIPLGATALSRFFTSIGIRHEIQSFDGDHFDHARTQLLAEVSPSVASPGAHASAVEPRGDGRITMRCSRRCSAAAHRRSVRRS